MYLAKLMITLTWDQVSYLEYILDLAQRVSDEQLHVIKKIGSVTLPLLSFLWSPTS